MKTYTIKTELSLEDAKKVILLGGLSLIPDEAKQAEAMADSMSSADTETATLRDQFAMAALQALLCTPREVCIGGRVKADEKYDYSNWADAAYHLADAMLEARKGKAQS